MTEQGILDAIAVGEDEDWEFKAAQGGVPGDMWETYSAMANTDGGTIALGVEESRGRWKVVGVSDPASYRKRIFDSANNRSTISHNLLSGSDVKAVAVEGKQVLSIRVRRAEAAERPVYKGLDMLVGTYRRCGEGDYHCSPEQVRRMIADQRPEGHDIQVLEHFTVDDLDGASVDEYRNRMSARQPANPWLGLDRLGFLNKIGAHARDREAGYEGLTVAGLLMFGKDEAMRDRLGAPEFAVDYRERLSEDSSVRWTDRLEPDGTWAANIFQFFDRAYRKLVADLKMPFRLQVQQGLLTRQGETPVHEAIREALVNSLIHADHRGDGGVIVERYRDRLVFSNPGTLLLPVRQILEGGSSVCRNKTLQRMFRLIGYGDTAGSGWDKIRKGWSEQRWREPRIAESVDPDRVIVTMSMVSLLPEDSVERLRERLGSAYAELRPEEAQALVTADVEGEVSNSRMQQLCEMHPSDITRLLQGLVSRSLLVQVGSKRGTSYRLADSPHKPEDSPHKPEDSPHKPEDSPHSLDDLHSGVRTQLGSIVAPLLRHKRRPTEETESTIVRLCQIRPLSAQLLAQLLNRKGDKLRDRFLNRMVRDGRLSLTYPDEPNHPAQAYRTVSEDSTP